MTTTGRNEFWLDGRKAIIRTGTKSQTVNICTRENKRGTYDKIYRLPIMSAIEADDVPEMADLDALDAWLVETRNAVLEGSSGAPVVRPEVRVETEDEAWSSEAARKVEQAIDLVVDDFVRHPYRHRVEHSLHLQLYSALIRHQEFDVLVPVGGSLHDGLVHKEWPETVPGVGADQRGLFDLAVLAPSQLARASIRQYRRGRVHAPIVIEVGLDYGRSHLEQDLEKLSNSRVPHAYVVHLSRLPSTGDVENLLTARYPNIKTAYAHVPPSGPGAVKHLQDDVIHRM